MTDAEKPEGYVDHFKRPTTLPPLPQHPFRKVCKRHPNGATDEPCSTCYRIRRRKTTMTDFCMRHPDGDTGAPCGTCAAIRRRRIERERKEANQ